MLELARNPPLSDLDSRAPGEEGDRFSLRMVAGLSIVKVQLGKQAHAGRGQVERVLGAALPENPRRAAIGEPTILWSAPGEWLIVTANRNPAELTASLTPGLAGQTHALTDLSDSFAVLELAGAAAAASLAQACAVDFHPSIFLPGQYALTRFGPLAILVHRHSAGEGLRLYVDRSLARFLWNWLLHAQHREHS